MLPLLMPAIFPRHIRFSAHASQGAGDYRPVLAHKRQTLELARSAKGVVGFSTANGTAPSELTTLQTSLKSHKKSFWQSFRDIMISLSFFPTILVGSLTGYLGMKTVSNIMEASKLSGVAQDEPVDWAVGQGFGTLLSGAFTMALFTIGLGDGQEGKYYRNALSALRGYRKSRAKLKQLKRSMLHLKPIQEPLEQKMVEVLNRKIGVMTDRFAQRFREKYHAVPDFKQFCHDVFGPGEASLPTAEGLRELFTYYLYRQMSNEQGKLQKKDPAMATELGMTQRLFAMITIGSKIGDVFKFMAPKPDAMGGQTFNPSLIPEIEVMEQVLQSQLDQVRGLMQKELETENYIAMARDALAPLELGELDRKAEADELKSLIKEFGQRKGKIEEALKEGIFKTDQNALFLDETLLNELQTELSEFMTRLKNALDGERQVEAVSLLCEQSPLAAQATDILKAQADSK